jgi:hypothetical protein
MPRYNEYAMMLGLLLLLSIVSIVVLNGYLHLIAVKVASIVHDHSSGVWDAYVCFCKFNFLPK